MDLSLGPEAERFLAEVREFFEAEATPELAAEMQSGLGFGPISWKFLRKLGDRGWLAPSLPPEWGGIAATYPQRHILMQEEYDLQLFFRRAKAAEVFLADPDHCRKMVATEAGL